MPIIHSWGEVSIFTTNVYQSPIVKLPFFLPQSILWGFFSPDTRIRCCFPYLHYYIQYLPISVPPPTNTTTMAKCHSPSASYSFQSWLFNVKSCVSSCSHSFCSPPILSAQRSPTAVSGFCNPRPPLRSMALRPIYFGSPQMALRSPSGFPQHHSARADPRPF